MQASGGAWPETAATLVTVLHAHPEAILLDVRLPVPSFVRLSGVPVGRRVVVVTGAEGLLATPPQRPPQTQAMVTNTSQLPPTVQAALPSAAVPVGSAQTETVGANHTETVGPAQQAASRAPTGPDVALSEVTLSGRRGSTTDPLTVHAVIQNRGAAWTGTATVTCLRVGRVTIRGMQSNETRRVRVGPLGRTVFGAVRCALDASTIGDTDATNDRATVTVPAPATAVRAR
jgi:hypothetical protein